MKTLRWLAPIALFSVLAVPAWSDVALPEGRLAKPAEGCPASEDVAVEDLDEVFAYGCEVVGVGNLLSEETDNCWYALDAECGGGSGDGGCGGA